MKAIPFGEKSGYLIPRADLGHRVIAVRVSPMCADKGATNWAFEHKMYTGPAFACLGYKAGEASIKNFTRIPHHPH
jgi:hypothetical protein